MRIHQLLAFEQSVLRSKIIGVYFNQFIKPNIFGGAPLEGDALKEKEDPVHGAFKELIVLKEKYGGDYLVGEHFTAADLAVWSSVFFMEQFDLLNVKDDHPEVHAWYERCASEVGCVEMKEQVLGFLEQLKASQ